MSTEKPSVPEKKTPVERMLRIAGGLIGLALGVEFVKGFFHHN